MREARFEILDYNVKLVSLQDHGNTYMHPKLITYLTSTKIYFFYKKEVIFLDYLSSDPTDSE